MIHKAIYNIGTKFRNPSLVLQLNQLNASDKATYSELENIQTQKLKDLVAFAYEYSSYYRKIFHQLKLLPSDFHSLDDIQKLPITEKKDLLTHCNEIQSTAKFRKLVFSETSGTTGQPLTIYRSEEWDSATRAAMFRGMGWYGVKPWEKNGYLWGYNISLIEQNKIRLLDSLQNRFRLFSYSEDEMKTFLNSLKNARYLSGYSSMIYELAKRVNQMGMCGEFPELKMVKGTSEKIFDSYQQEVKKAFGIPMISEYGSMESGIIAYECPEGHNMHIAMENVIVEEINGNAIVTNLCSHSFPIIRYKLGDAIELADKEYRCTCGREHRVLKSVIGRVGKTIIGERGKYPSLTFYYVFKNIALQRGLIANYQAIQNKPGQILLKIEQPYSEALDFGIKDELTKYFLDDISFSIQYGSTLHKMDGKLRDFISEIE